MKNILSLFVVLFVVGMMSSTASAQTIFNNSTGTGSVDSSTVAYSLGYSKRQMDKNKDGVTFSYSTTNSYQVVCEGTGEIDTMFETVETEVTSVIRTSRRGVFDGYLFTGFGAELSYNATVPCGGNGYSLGVRTSSDRGTLSSHSGGVTGRLYF